MKKTINLIITLHQPFRLRQFRFFDIGNDHYYYDDYANESLITWLARKSYLPVASMLLRMIARHGRQFRFSLYVSGCALEQFRKYAPAVTESIKKLADTGNVELLGGTWSYSPAALIHRSAFEEQVSAHRNELLRLAGQKPVTFFSPGMLYSDALGAIYSESGFRAVIAEGSSKVLGWRSPDMLYGNPVFPDFKILLNNPEVTGRLTDLIIQNHGNTPSGQAEEFVTRLGETTPGEQSVNMCMDLELPGMFHEADSGGISVMEEIINRIAVSDKLQFSTPSDTARHYPPASLLSIPHPVARENEGNSFAALYGNDLQREAMGKLFEMTEYFRGKTNAGIHDDWMRLQSCEHFLYMASHYYEREEQHRPNPHKSPHEAFINYMNILSDLKIRTTSE